MHMHLSYGCGVNAFDRMHCPFIQDTPKAAAPDAGKPMRAAEGQAVVRKRPVVEEAEAPAKESKAIS